MAATLTLSSTVLNGSFAYTDTGVSASGTFSANDGAVVGLSGSDALGDFIAEAANDGYVYTLKPADIDDAADLAAVAAAVVAAINEELTPASEAEAEEDNS
jgi:hypothetical protein